MTNLMVNCNLCLLKIKSLSQYVYACTWYWKLTRAILWKLLTKCCRCFTVANPGDKARNNSADGENGGELFDFYMLFGYAMAYPYWFEITYLHTICFFH